MIAAELRADLKARGMTLRADGSRLIVTPASLLTAADRELIGRCRGDLLRLLHNVKQGHCLGCRDWLPGSHEMHGYCTPCILSGRSSPKGGG